MLFISSLLVASLGFAAAESGLEAWLRYAPLPNLHPQHYQLPSTIVALNSSDSSPVGTAGREIKSGIESIFGRSCEISNGYGQQQTPSSIVVGTLDQYNNAYGALNDTPVLGEDGFWLDNTGNTIHILGQNERGALFGAFEYLSMMAQGNFSKVAYGTSPDAGIRWINQWDNMDGSIERGYGGASIFFANGTIKEDLTRAAQYARLCASIRLNAVVVNNVNANATLLTDENIAGLGRIADVFRPYGVQLAISLKFDSPNMTEPVIGTYDPLLSEVQDWWHNKTERIYRAVPDFAGYLVKANSEGQAGPAEYNRTLAEGANLFARAIKPYGGIVMFRSFVYDYQDLDEDIWTDDRANAAVDYFQPLDGKFDDNVVVQTKFGPIDFQVREPPSPLFANLRRTSQAIELQLTPEYLGQQSHIVYVAPQWKEILDFDMRADHDQSLVSDIVSGERFSKPLGGYAGVSNVGMNLTWYGSHLSLSNLYAFGRLAWDPSQNVQTMLQDWIRLTFGVDQDVVDKLTSIEMESWPAYENYSGNLGIQTLTDIIYTHYGPRPQSQDGNSWGQWTRADRTSIGMDRTLRNGTGNSRQYPDEILQKYEHRETTPDNLMLWFHHVNYTTRLHSGKTVIQHFYDAHYDGAATAQTFVDELASLEGKIDTERFEAMMYTQVYQAGHAIVWRDAINNYYHNLSGIDDEAGRVGNHVYRIEAESMELEGYELYDVAPFEAASGPSSGYRAIVTSSNTTAGTATTVPDVEDGIYDVAVNYYDLYGGEARWEVFLSDKKIGEVLGNAGDYLGHQPSIYLDGHSAIRKTFGGVAVARGEVLRIVGHPDGNEQAPVDYVSVLPLGVRT
ncbi:hypothetical protein MBLNU230_g7109t1 [Neophaeotheca triangularis]